MASTSATSLIGRSRWSLAANSLTILRFVGAPIVAVMVFAQNPWWLTFVFGLSLATTDYFDGNLARRAEPTRLGTFLDPLADKAVVLLVGYALVSIDRFHWIPIALIAVREVGLTIYRSYWGRQGLAIPARTSAKYKAVVQGAALLAAVCPPFEPYPWVADLLLWVAVAFTLYTGAQYLVDGRGALRTTGVR